jgi:nucleoid-associated protein EbfC
MFKELGQMMGLMKQLPKIKEEMERLQQRLGQISAEGDAGAGMVKVRVNGKQELVACTISDEAFKAGDREMLEEMIRGAVNQAMERVRRLVAEETNKMASNLGMPPGMGLPGLPGAEPAGGEEEG